MINFSRWMKFQDIRCGPDFMTGMVRRRRRMESVLPSIPWERPDVHCYCSGRKNRSHLQNTLSGNILHRKHIFHAGIWVKYRRVEYAFQLDGPYDERKGLRFNKDNILLDPYARAVTGQRHWGERPEGGKDFVYHARVVENNFDWEKSRFLNHPFEDLVIYEMHVRGFTRDASSGVKAPGTLRA